MRRSHVVALVLTVLISIGALGAVLAARTTPILGLDLRGGLSVLLQPVRKVDTATLNQTINIIRNRVDALGVSNANIAAQGGDINVELPGVKDPQKVLKIVGTTAVLSFRPVLGNGNGDGPKAKLTDSTLVTTTGTAELPEKDATGKNVVNSYLVGPQVETGKIVKGAVAQISTTTGAWVVDFTTTTPGTQALANLSQQYLNKNPVAIVLDNQVQSAPVFTQAITNGQGEISGSFNQQSAGSLALVLRYGALPVALKEPSIQTVSASLGKDSLKAGLLAGVGGLVLVLLYIVVYYRALGLVAFLGLALTAALLYPIVAELGKTSGLTLTLAGITGVIVSIGVTVDSYIVYFERLKDEIRSGKTVRSSVDRGFARAFRTIVAADLVSLIGSVVLYLLSVGPVRGFAFFLGLSTLLDLLTSYFFTRPLVILLGRSRVFTEARHFGVARGLGGAALGGAQ